MTTKKTPEQGHGAAVFRCEADCPAATAATNVRLPTDIVGGGVTGRSPSIDFDELSQPLRLLKDQRLAGVDPDGHYLFESAPHRTANRSIWPRVCVNWGSSKYGEGNVQRNGDLAQSEDNESAGLGIAQRAGLRLQARKSPVSPFSVRSVSAGRTSQ